MSANDSWVYQGRQSHGWFGHGTAPQDLLSLSEPGTLFDPAESRQRIAYVVSSLLGHVPRQDRAVWESVIANLPPDAWTKAMQAWHVPAHSGRGLARDHGGVYGGATTEQLHAAARGAVLGRRYEDLAKAGENLAAAARRIGPYNWRRFILDAGVGPVATQDGSGPLGDSVVRAADFAFYLSQGLLPVAADDHWAEINAVNDRLRAITRQIVEEEQYHDGVDATVPEGYSYATYGAYLHGLFAKAVEGARIRNVSVEVSFANGDEANYGVSGSIRTDVVLRHSNRVLAVWDYKTGPRTSMPQSRVNDISDGVGKIYGEVPIVVIMTYTDTVIRMR